MKKSVIVVCFLTSIVAIAGCSTTYKVTPPSSTTTMVTNPSPYSPPVSTSTTTYHAE